MIIFGHSIFYRQGKLYIMPKDSVRSCVLEWQREEGVHMDAKQPRHKGRYSKHVHFNELKKSARIKETLMPLRMQLAKGGAS